MTQNWKSQKGKNPREKLASRLHLHLLQAVVTDVYHHEMAGKTTHIY